MDVIAVSYHRLAQCVVRQEYQAKRQEVPSQQTVEIHVMIWGRST